MLRWMQQTRNYNTPSKPHAKHIKAKQKMQVHLKVERGSLRLHWLWSSGPLEPCTISLPVWRPEESAPWSPRFCVHCRPRCWQTWGYRRPSFSAWQVKKGQHASHHSLSTSPHFCSANTMRGSVRISVESLWRLSAAVSDKMDCLCCRCFGHDELSGASCGEHPMRGIQEAMTHLEFELNLEFPNKWHDNVGWYAA